LKIDFAKKTIRPARGGEDIPDTLIERSERVDGKLILQGAEDGYAEMRDGLGWTMAISEESGLVVLTTSGDEVGFVVFGACTPL
jgi:sugar lactone lactonase YvrE